MPRFFNQKIAANEPEKNIPSTAAKATTRSAYVAFLSAIHLRAQSAFFLTHGIVSIALNRYSLWERKRTLITNTAGQTLLSEKQNPENAFYSYKK